MFARNVSIRLKQNSAAEFTKLYEEKVLPTLQKQPGFSNAILLAGDNGMYMTSITLWDTKEHAEIYHTTGYTENLKSLDNVLDGPPKIRASNVIHSTIHELVAAAA